MICSIDHIQFNGKRDCWREKKKQKREEKKMRKIWSIRHLIKILPSQMIDLRPRFCTVRLYWAEDNLANEMNFVTNHAPGAGTLARPVDQKSSALPLHHGRPSLQHDHNSAK